jgi:pimeloyl-ACP methyl ester carboxylesterase
MESLTASDIGRMSDDELEAAGDALHLQHLQATAKAYAVFARHYQRLSPQWFFVGALLAFNFAEQFPRAVSTALFISAVLTVGYALAMLRRFRAVRDELDLTAQRQRIARLDAIAGELTRRLHEKHRQIFGEPN